MPKFTSLLLILSSLLVTSQSKAGWLDFLKRPLRTQPAVTAPVEKPRDESPSMLFRAYAADDGAIIVRFGGRLFYGSGNRYSEQTIMGWGASGSGSETTYIAVAGKPALEGFISGSALKLSPNMHQRLNKKVFPRLDPAMEQRLAADFQADGIHILNETKREPKWIFEGKSNGKTWTLLIDKSEGSNTDVGFAKSLADFTGHSELQRVYIGTDGKFTPVLIEKEERHFPHFQYLVMKDDKFIQLLKGPTFSEDGQPNGMEMTATFKTPEGQPVFAKYVRNVTREALVRSSLDGYSETASDFRLIGESLANTQSTLSCEKTLK